MMGDLLKFPTPEGSTNNEMLWLEKEILERKLEDVNRKLGLVAPENGVE